MGVHLSHPDIFHPFEENVNRGVRFWSRVKHIPMHVWVVNKPSDMISFSEDAMIKGIISDDSKLLIETIGAKVL